MGDIHDKKTRSRNMAAISSSRTKPELIVKGLLRELGFGRILPPEAGLYGRPDLLFEDGEGRKICIFVHGCFWHGHECPAFRLPATNREFWFQKISANKERDLAVRTFYKCQERFRYLYIWECSVCGPEKLHRGYLLEVLRRWLLGTDNGLDIEPEQPEPLIW